MSPRLAGAPLSPSWAATERVLFLIALRAAMRPTSDDGAAVLAAWGALASRVEREWLDLAAASPVGGARARLWIVAAQREARSQVAALALGRGLAVDVTARAAVLVWAAVAAWSDAPSGRWGELAALATALADALDAAVDGSDALDVGTSAHGTGRAAMGLRAVMAETWRTMEAGR